MNRGEEIVNNIGYQLTRAAVEYVEKHEFSDGIDCFEAGAEWMQKKMIEKACECYCDDVCDKGRCGMCFHKHDGKGQVKNSFQYNECNELKLMRKAMEE